MRLAAFSDGVHLAYCETASSQVPTHLSCAERPSVLVTSLLRHQWELGVSLEPNAERDIVTLRIDSQEIDHEIDVGGAPTKQAKLYVRI